MNTINQLSTLNTLSGGDNLVLYSSGNGDARKTSLTTLTTYLNTALSFPTFTTQRSSPLTGATVIVTDGSANIHLILTPAGTLATLTVSLPSTVNAADKQEVLVNCTQIVTTLTVNVSGGGATSVNGAPTAFTANGFFRMKFDKTGDAWYRVG